MKVVRERPCQRRYHRVTAPMKVQLPDGSTMMATNWSLGGLRLDSLAAPLPETGAILDLSLSLPFQGFDISFDVHAKVMRSEVATGTIGCEFQELSERANDLLSHFIDDLVRGAMATVDDTICRIDVPVTPISTKPDPNPAEGIAAKRIPMKTIFMSCLYGLLGIATFSYLGTILYSNFMRMEVRSAVISAPLATLKMPVDGILRPVRFEMGGIIRKGQEIARIENADFLSQLEDKRIELETARRSQRRAEEKYRIEADRMKLYQVISRTDRQIAQAKVDASRAALSAADNSFERMSKLFRKKLVTLTKFEVAKKERAQAEARLRDAEFILERATAMNSVSSRKHFNHKEFVADLDMYALEIEEANAAVKTAHMQLEKLEKLRTTMTITAPYDGRIVSIQQAANTIILRNEPLLTIEQRVDPTVTAFLDQDQVLKIGLNDTAKVFLPSLAKHIDATVTMVDRNSTFINSDRSHYAWKDGAEKSAAVSLKLDLRSHDVREITAGLPAVVIFPKRQVNDIYQRFGTLFSGSEPATKTNLFADGNHENSI